MAIYAVKVLGLAKGEEIRLFVALTVPAIVGSYLAGLVSDRIGPRRTLTFVLWGWMAGLAAIALAPSLSAFWIGGALLGFVFGGIWSVERPLLLTLVPDAEAGRFFGLLVLSARAAAIVGPLVWAFVADYLFSPFGRASATARRSRRSSSSWPARSRSSAEFRTRLQDRFGRRRRR
jgi:UMF1 family MFS transporter